MRQDLPVDGVDLVRNTVLELLLQEPTAVLISGQAVDVALSLLQRHVLVA